MHGIEFQPVVGFCLYRLKTFVTCSLLSSCISKVFDGIKNLIDCTGLFYAIETFLKNAGQPASFARIAFCLSTAAAIFVWHPDGQGSQAESEVITLSTTFRCREEQAI